MTLRELWSAHFIEGSMFRAGGLGCAIRRASWHPDVALIQSDNQQVVIATREAGHNKAFAMPWGATPDDMMAEDWEAVT